jgi:hypothetical protein
LAVRPSEVEEMFRVASSLPNGARRACRE